MDGCVFCGILREEIPSERLLEAPSAIAILDIQPVRPGHALVIARPHIERLVEADATLLAGMMDAVLKLAPAVMRATGSDGFNLVINNGTSAGQVVHHLHLHIIPRATGDGLRFRWRQGRYGEGEMGRVGSAIRAGLA